MQGELKKHAINIIEYVEQIKIYKLQLQKIKIQERAYHQIKISIRSLIEKIEKEEIIIYKIVRVQEIKKIEIRTIPLPKPQIVLPKPKVIPKGITLEEIPVIELESETYRSLNKKEKEGYIKELNIDYDQLDYF